MAEELNLPQLRFLTLESQGLTKPYPFGKGKDAVLKALEHLGYLQIDTLSIVERAHHHTLWTRIPDYTTEYLDELVDERKLFEYWFHAASYLPMKDFRFALPQMLEVKQSKTHYYNADPKVMKYVLDTIRGEGPKKARDFENETKKAGSWWSWKPTKVALERLFLQGDLMISSSLLRMFLQYLSISFQVGLLSTNLLLPCCSAPPILLACPKFKPIFIALMAKS